MRVDRYSPAPTLLASGAPRREPSRPPEYRDPTFAEKFDDATLFYDAVFVASGRSVLLLGPPHFNLAEPLARSTFTLPTGARLTAQIRQMDRHAQVRLAVPAGAERIVADGPLGRCEIAPRQPRLALFAGKRVLLTLSKNNDLAWIRDWIRYHRDIHGANAVLLYDNASTKYDAGELAAAIEGLGGIEAACVVEWPFKYGPQGASDARFWDSDFCQRGVLEHARWFFLRRARSVLNGDVDELVAGGDGRGVFAAAERSLTGMACYFGVWVDGLDGGESPSGSDHSYAPFAYYTDPARSPYGYSNTKWVVAPARCSPRFQWAPHNIIGARGLYTRLSLTKSYLYRHYREISDGWKYERARRLPYDPELYVRDAAMTRAFERVDWTR